MNPSTLMLALVVLIVVAFVVFNQWGGARSDISYTFFRQQLAAGNVAEVEQDQQVLTGRFRTAPRDSQSRAIGRDGS